MTLKHLIKSLTVVFILATPIYANASSSFDEELLFIQHTWAQANYSLNDDAQDEAFLNLITQAEEFAKNHPNKAEAHIWLGIIQSSYAGAKGGLGALSYAKAAKKSLEQALEIDATALNGSAYTSLGILYHKVPGWPIAFGDDDDAKDLLEKALALNPKGIDPNYFYAEFLFDERDYAQSKKHLMLAKKAEPRPERPLADIARRSEVEALLAKVESKLSK